MNPKTEGRNGAFERLLWQMGAAVYVSDFETDALRVLVVDDAPEIRDYFRHVMGGFRIRSDAAESGFEALRMAERQALRGAPYNVVFIDWKMPGMDGLQTALCPPCARRPCRLLQ